MKNHYLLRLLLLMLLCLSLTPTAWAQTAASYVFAPINGVTAESTPGNILISASSTFNFRSNPVNIGFTFVFAGVSYTQFTADAGGVLQFGAQPNGAPGFPRDNNTPGLTPGSDSFGTTGFNGGVSYGVVGTSPNRKLVVEWRQSGGGVPDNASRRFQVWLFEGSNAIQMVYASGTADAERVTVGIAASETDFLCVDPATNLASSTEVPDAGGFAYTAGRSFRFEPVVASTAPTITGFTPTTGTEGTSVTVSGTRLTGITAIRVNGTAGTIMGTPTATAVTFTVGTGSTSGRISLSTPGGLAVSSSSFSFAPGITSFTPTSGATGRDVTITGTNLSTVTAVTVNGTPGILVGTPGNASLTFRVGTGSTTGPISVVNPAGTAISSTNFTVTNSVTNVAPASGPVGTVLTITGVGFTNITGVRFGEVPAPFTVNSDAQLTVTVPRLASSQPIRITRGSPGSLTFSSELFTVTRPLTGTAYSLVTSGLATNASTGAVPALADFDGDGQLDLLIGRADGAISHFEQSAVNAATFTLVTHNFNGINVGGNAAPTLTDLDGNGRLDLLIGRADGTISLYRQDAMNSTTFTLAANNLGNIDVGDNSAPAFTDFNGDGLLDMLLGNANGSVSRFSQSSLSPTIFSSPTNFSDLALGNGSSPKPFVTDLDGNGRLDVLFGLANGTISRYEQTATNATTVALVSSNFAGLSAGTDAAPILTDIDGNGALDLLLGRGTGAVDRYEQTSAGPTITSLSPASGPAGTVVTINGTNLTGTTAVVLRGIPVNITPISNTQVSFVVPAQASTGPIRLTTPGGTVLSGTNFTVTRASSSLTYVQRSASFNNIDVGTFSTPAITDLDHDGLIDLLVGREIDGLVSHYEQSAPNSLSFTLRANNLSGLTGHFNSLVSVTDIDGDGLLDMVVGIGAGNFKHYEQSAPNSNSFTQLSNDFNNIVATGGIAFQIPHFTDVDGDGLLDLLVGDEFLSRYEQTAANGGTFTQLNNQDFGPTDDAGNGGAAACVVDLDGNGRLDMLIGRQNGQLFHYEQSSANSTAFTQISTAFNGLSLSGYTTPAITDLDGDGLLDLLVGGADGQIRHFEQAAPPVFTSDPVSKSVCSGSGTTFTVATTGASSFQWQVNTGSGFTNLSNTGPYSGVTSTTLTISNVAGLTGFQYRCVATGDGISVNSNAATLTVNPLPIVTNPTVSTATQGQAFSQAFTASNGQTPYSFSLASGTLPTGLSLTSTGVLSGTPSQSGSFPITVRATDANGCVGVGPTYSLTVSSSTVICNSSPDYQPLVDLYNATNGPNWNNNTGWLSGCDPCTGNNGNPWFGVFCLNGRVNRIILAANQLSGSIPASLSGLTTVKFIELDGNRLTGAIPSELSGLPSLELLNLGSNQLSGSIPASLGTLQNLRALDLFKNQLTGSIPSGLSAATNLEVIRISENQLTGSIPASFTTLTNLRELIVGVNQLTGGIPTNIGSLTALTTLDVAFNPLGGPIPPGLGTLPLIILEAQNAQLTGCFPASLSALCGRDIRLGGNPGLPGGGNFAAFCATGAGSDAFVARAGASQSTVCVGSVVSLSASGGTSYTWSVPSGAILSATTGAVVSATLTTAGPKTFTTVVSNGGGSCTATATASVTVNTAPVVTNPTVSTATVSTAFSQSFTASGGTAPYSFSLASGTLPPGLSLSTAGVLSGTPSQSGSFTLTVRATEASGCVGVGPTYSLTVTAPVVSQPIRYVRQDGTGDGTSWATASGNLQSQIDAPGVEQVWVAAGLYKPTTTTGPNSRTISFSMKNGVAIYGGFPATGNPNFAQRGAVNPVTGSPSSSTLSGDIGTIGNNSDNTYNVIYNGPGLTLTAILDGFVITGGNANSNQLNIGSRRGGGVYNDGGAIDQVCSPTIRNCLFQHNAASDRGSALFNDANNGSASPQLTNCVFESNTGVAIFNESDLGASSPVITNCSFLNNAGGGIFINVVQDNTVSQLTLANCLFRNNSAFEGGAIFGNYEIGAAQQNNIVRITNCVFEENSASTGGGAVTGLGNNRYEVVGSTFRNNSASGNGSSGGAIYSADPIMTFTNCLFEGNSATRSGGGIEIQRASKTLFINCSFLNNSASSSGGVVRYVADDSLVLRNCSFQGNIAPYGSIINKGNSSTKVALTNCVLFGNESEIPIGDDSQQVRVSYSLLEPSVTGYTSGPGNLTTTVSPFASTTSTQLKGCSPAINAGDPATTTATVGTTDLAGNPRFFNNAGAPAGRIDMGAYEFQGNPTAITVTNPTVMTATVSTAFNQTFTASNGQIPYSFSLAGGTLPTGLSLTSTGVLSGTPSQSGIFPITVRATDANGCVATGGVYSLTVNAPATVLSIARASGTPTKLTAVVYVVTFDMPVAGLTAANFSVVTTGLSGGAVTGITNTGPSTYNVSVNTGTGDGTLQLRLNNGTGLTPSVSNLPFDGEVYTIDKTAPTAVVSSPASTSTAPIPFAVDFSENVSNLEVKDILVTNGTAGALVGGGSSYTLSVTPTDPGAVTVRLAADAANDLAGNGNQASNTVSVTYAPAPTITGFAALDNTVCVGSPVTFTATVGNVTGFYSFTLTDGVTTLANSTSMSAFSRSLTPSQTGPLTVTLITGDNGFTSTATTTITVNAFSPDYQPLADLYNATNGANWSNNTGWLNGCDPCTGNAGNPWSGLTCANGRVTRVSLFSNNLVGTIPASLSALSNLTGLILENNQLSGPIPPSLSALSNLTQLNVGFNRLSGGIPSSLSALTNLTSLNLGVNGLSGSIPASLSALSNLTGLILRTNGLNGPIPAGLGALDKLTLLDLGTNELSGAIPPSLGALGNLNLLNLSFNQLSGCFPASLSALCGRTVNFSNNAALPGEGDFAAFCATGAGSDAFVARAGASQSTVCVGSVVSLTASGGTAYSWIAPAGVTLSSPATGSVVSATLGVSGLQTFTVVASNGGSCTAMATVGVLVNPAVSVINPATNTVTINTPFSQTFTASGGAGIYSFSRASGSLPNGLTLNTAGVLSGTPTQGGSFTLTVQARDANGCVGVGPAYVLTVNAVPTITGFAAVDNSVCVGSPVTFTATVGNVIGFYSFTLTNGVSTITNATNQSAFSRTLTPTQTGPQTFTLIAGDNGFTSTATTTVTINVLPVAGLTNNGPLTCSQTSVTLTASGGTSYSFSAGADQLGSSNRAVVNTPGTYSVMVDDGNGCVSSTSTTVVSGTAVVTVANPTTNAVAVNTPFSQTFTASGGVGPYSYSLASGDLPNGLSLASTGVLSGTPRQGGSFPLTVQATDANGCVGVSAPYVLTVNAVPTITGFAAVDNSVCVGSPVTFTASVGNVTGFYSFTLTDGVSTLANSTSMSAFSRSLTPSQTGPLTVTLITGDNGFTSTATTTVTINVLPVAGLTNNGPLTCSQTSVTLTASGGSSGEPFSYTFTDSSGSVLAGSGNTRSVSASGTYSVMVSDANGCVSSTSTTVVSGTAVVAVSNPTTTAVAINTSFSQSFTASGGVGPYSYSLASGDLPNGLSLSTAGVLSGTPRQGGSFTLTVQATDANGCVGVGPAYVLTVNAVPTITGFAAVDNSVCVGSPVTFTATVGNVTGFYSFTLTNGVSTITNATNQSAFSRTLTPTRTGPQTFTLIAGDNGFTSMAIASVTINALPVAGLTNNGPLTCEQTSVTLTASGGTSYVFSGNATQIGTTNQATVNAAGTYSVTVASASGCVSTTSTSVESSTTAASVSISPASALLTCTSPIVSLTALGEGDVRWSTAETSPIISVSVAGNYSVTLTNASGCTATASVTVEQAPDQTLAFTQQPLSATSVTVGATVTTGVVVSGNPTAYQWYKDNLNSPVSGQTSATLTLTNIQLTDAGSYSVVVTGACNIGTPTGLTSSAFSLSVVTPAVPLALTLSASPTQLLTNQSTTLTAIVAGGTAPYSYSFAGPGILISNGNTAIVSSLPVGVQTLTVVVADAVNPAQTLTGTVSVTVGEVVSAPFAITAVTTISCTPVLPNRYSVSFAPRYSGLTGQPISFSVVNELFPTLDGGPYTIRLYTDNPRITLSAVQQGTPGEALFVYDWLAACRASESSNTPPTVLMAVPPQSATVGVGYSYVIPEGTFSDAQTPASLALSAQGLPLGIGLSGYTLSGVPSTTVGSPYSVTLTATDPGGLSVSTVVGFSVSPATGPVAPTPPFAITGVTTISCTPIFDRININFVPQYVGVNGQAIAFGVVNELLPTNEPGPYSLTLYRDNPVITLRATQTGSTEPTSFAYHWLAACASQGQDNTPPVVVNPIGSQTAVVGVNFELNFLNTFVDQETPGQGGLRYAVSGLPAGLSLVNTSLRGVASVTGVSTVVLTATDAGGLSTTVSFGLTVQSAPVSGLALRVQANPTQVTVGGSATLTAQASGGTAPYSYSFSGPGSVSVVGNVAVFSNLSLGEQAFMVVVSDGSQPTPQQLSVGVSVTVAEPSSQTGPFSITGVQPLSCVGVGPGQRQVSFSPQYAGVTGEPISFSVVNELLPTQQAGPYSLRLYTDNPVITLSAQQGSQVVSYAYHWLAGCQAPARLGSSASADAVPGLQVVVLGNPIQGNQVAVAVRGAQGQALRLELTDPAGRPVSEQRVESAGRIETLTLSVGGQPAGILLLRVSSPSQTQTLKLLKR
ncbi:putative Ig domain-containing protein [Spirosoma soli]|uniref:Ig domain-containing protein n=1 Tax=Spirosoma soli TaxID=1770529 RepID=A0ABW5M564_9BACT